MKNPMKFYAIATMILVLVLAVFVIAIPQKINLQGGGKGNVSYFRQSKPLGDDDEE